MNDDDGFPNGVAAGGRRNDSVARLIQLAGPRAVIPEDVRMRVHGAVRRQWKVSCQRRKTFAWGIPFALAAAVAGTVVVLVRVPEPLVAPVATVVRVEQGTSASSPELVPGAKVLPGVPLSTGTDGVALALNNGFSVRLQAATTVTFESPERVRLDAGRLYADTGQAIYDDRSITVLTPIGSATDVGTQFAVAFADGDMRVAVREGRVDVAAGTNAWTAKAGELLTIAPGSDAIVAQISRYDNSWDWASSLAPAFEIENQSLLDFLKWAARETGRELVFENDAARQAAMRTMLSGSIADFTPMEAVVSVLPTTRFEYRIEPQRIVISQSR